MGYICVEDPETGEEVEVEYELHGSYMRQTLFSPAEYPEVYFLNPLPAGVDEQGLTEQVLEQEADYAEEAKYREYYADDYDY